MKSLVGTKTRENLLKSFAGESQARNRYYMYAKVADKEGYKQIAKLFLETAENEYQHAKRFFNFLVEGLQEELPTVVEINAGYPVAMGNTVENLKAAAAGENEEWHDLYPSFAQVAKEEGFPEIAAAYLKIADAEQRHETRFIKLKENVENGKVFEKDQPVQWICQKCGYVHTGTSAPKTCPSCLHPQNYFELFVENY
ncbi:MAG TPA: rubrerythrin family protein [Clostridiales bacterium]|nr:rubrerythrin family protein [Clostridiales bacterium]